MAVYAKEVSGRLDRMERRLSNVEARSAPGTPQSAISIADSPMSQQNKPDSSDVDSNPDEEEVAKEVGAFASLYIQGYMYIYMYTLSIPLACSHYSATPTSGGETDEERAQEEAFRRPRCAATC